MPAHLAEVAKTSPAHGSVPSRARVMHGPSDLALLRENRCGKSPFESHGLAPLPVRKHIIAVPARSTSALRRDVRIARRRDAPAWAPGAGPVKVEVVGMVCRSLGELFVDCNEGQTGLFAPGIHVIERCGFTNPDGVRGAERLPQPHDGSLIGRLRFSTPATLVARPASVVIAICMRRLLFSASDSADISRTNRIYRRRIAKVETTALKLAGRVP